jgi:hypothetical protein
MMDDIELRDDLTEYAKRNWQKKEILDFIQDFIPCTPGVSGLCPADYNFLVLDSLITR